MTGELFTRSPLNPILAPGGRWWESRGVLNPGAAIVGDQVALVYRAVGADGLSRFGLAWTHDGERIDERGDLPWYEGGLDDPYARLGVEDPRITSLDDRWYLTYCKASVEPAATPPLSWEPAPFRVRSAVGVAPSSPTPLPRMGEGSREEERDCFVEAVPSGDPPNASDSPPAMTEIATILPDRNSKDAVLFPARIGGRYAALIRLYPSIQYLTSDDLATWSEPRTILEPIPGTWEGERVGAGPPPLLTPWGWLLLYHGNEYLRFPGNQRLYRMGLAVLDAEDPARVLYRHPEPVFSPSAPYEAEGPVGNVVFGTGLVERDGRLFMYYGAGDGVIGVATAEREAVWAFLRKVRGEPPA